jgi:NAD(P)-dependent dehydrogenase (short-subunit alcohol dehydrogenase family)
LSTYDITGKSIIVTGAAGGIGSATTRALVARGAHVTLVDLAQESVDEVAATLPAERVLALAADVTSAEQMTAAVDAAVEHFGRLDVVFTNAGIANDPRRRLPRPTSTPTRRSSRSTCSGWCARSSPRLQRSSATAATS